MNRNKFVEKSLDTSKMQKAIDELKNVFDQITMCYINENGGMIPTEKQLAEYVAMRVMRKR